MQYIDNPYSLITFLVVTKSCDLTEMKYILFGSRMKSESNELSSGLNALYRAQKAPLSTLTDDELHALNYTPISPRFGALNLMTKYEKEVISMSSKNLSYNQL